MLTQWPPRDPKCKLNVSFLTFPHPLDCLVCTKYIIIIVLLPEMMRGWDGWWWFIYVWVWVEDRGWVSYFFLFFVQFLCCCSLFFYGWHMIVVVSVSLFFFCFVSCPFNQALLVHRNCCVCFVKLFQKSGFRSQSVNFLEKGTVV